MRCPTCGDAIHEESARFCPHCGTALPKEEEELPYVGVSKDRGIYRLEFDAVTGEFESEEHAWNAVGESYWAEDRAFGRCEVTFVKSLVPPEDYPFICGGCGEYVSDTNQGKCGNCGGVNWVPRQ